MSSFAKCASTVTFMLALASGPAAFAGTSHDGKWVVSVVAKAGACNPTRTIPIHVNGGRVRYAGMFNAVARGRVQASGKLNVSFSHKDQVVRASGVLNGKTGRGSWQSPTKSCTGSWTARKA